MKQKVFIVLLQKMIIARAARRNDQWEVEEKVEFVTQLKTRHISNAVAIGDFVNEKMIKGSSNGMGDYNKFIEYVRTKFPNELQQLETLYAANTDEGTGSCVTDEEEVKSVPA